MKIFRCISLNILVLSLGVLLSCAWFSCAWAQPNSFPEDALELQLSYGHGLAFSTLGELRMPFNTIDGSLSLQLFGRTFISDKMAWGGRLGASALIFPAVGTVPPLALGLGADIGYDTVRGFSTHMGPTVGTDLLFVFDTPMTLSVYVAPGYSTETGLSLAWNTEVRYYLNNNWAMEFASSDIAPLSLSMRYAFY